VFLYFFITATSAEYIIWRGASARNVLSIDLHDFLFASYRRFLLLLGHRLPRFRGIPTWIDLRLAWHLAML